MPDAKSRARKIRLLLFDVDGVLTDGKLFFLPAAVQDTGGRAGGPGRINPTSQGSIEVKGFHAHDGVAISLARLAGITAAESCFVGDDVIDLPVMWNCGLAIAAANARDEVKRDAHYVTKHGGGDGALRDAIEFILKAQNKWKQVLTEYIGQRSPGSQ